VEALENRDVDPKVAVFALQRTNNDFEQAYLMHNNFRLDDDDVDMYVYVYVFVWCSVGVLDYGVMFA